MSPEKVTIRNCIHKKEKRTKTIEGTITVEASFIMPFAILITFALIYLSFCLHDMCRIRGVVDGTLHKAGLAYKHESSLETGDIRYEAVNSRGIFYILTGDTGQFEKAMNYHILSRLSGGLLLFKIIDVDSEVGKLSISTTVRSKATIKLPIFGKLFENYFSTRITGSYPIHNPAETLRACETVLQTGSEIKGMEQLKSSLQKLLP
jgi:hypothetical protein